MDAACARSKPTPERRDYVVGVLVVLIVTSLGSGIALSLFGLAAWGLIPLAVAVALGVVSLSRQRPVSEVSDDQANRIQLGGRRKTKDFF